MSKQKIKILFYGMSDNNGGVETDVLAWFKHKPNNYQFDFLYDGKEPMAFEKEFLNGGSKIYRITHRYSNPVKRFFEISEIIRKNNYSYVHMNTEIIDEGSPILFANITKGCKPIIHIHSNNDREFPLKEKLLIFETKLMLLGQNYLRLACGKEVGESMFKDKDFSVIENGVDRNKYRYNEKTRNAIRKKYHISKNTKIIGHVGHVCEEKNYPFIFKTIQSLKNDKNDIKLMLIGNVCYDNQILKMISDLQIENEVIKIGLVEDTSPYYSAMDLFFLPSFNEGMPLVAVEAQMTGLPCVISERVTKESKISKNVKFIKLDLEEAQKSIVTYLNKKIDRENVKVDGRYDIVVSSKKLFKYYEDHLIK